MDFNEEGVSRVFTKTSVDLNAVATTTLGTVPPDKVMIVDHIKPHNLSADAASCVATFGQSSAKTDFVAAQTLSNLSAVGKSAKIQPVPNATPPAIVEYAAGQRPPAPPARQTSTCSATTKRHRV
jgi:hypothetical protein